jgi:HSP20 family molecular chaperone IbpA
MHENYQKSFERNKEIYGKNLKRQGDQFQETFRRNENAQRESVSAQKEMFNKELAQAKKQFFVSNTSIQQRKDDPFYKMQDRGSQMTETDNSYVLRTYLPEKDQDTVKVRILGDRAVVAGARTYKDKLEDDGKKIDTSNYQTFHEEFKFVHPVANNHIMQERDGDFVSFVIPKIGSMNKKA